MNLNYMYCNLLRKYVILYSCNLDEEDEFELTKIFNYHYYK